MDNSKLPDFRNGIETRDLADGAIVSGRIDSEEAILVRRGDSYFAVGAQCTHYIASRLLQPTQRRGAAGAGLETHPLLAGRTGRQQAVRARTHPGRRSRRTRRRLRCRRAGSINYVGHAESWDTPDIDGSPASRDCAVTYKRGGRILAVASIARDLQSLKAERELELT
jgi:hypothetical protein